MAHQTIQYSVRELIGSPIAAHGEQLRDLLLAHLAQGQTVTLDFAEMRVVFPQFLHTALGELLHTYDPPTVRQHIHLLNLPPAMERNLSRYIEDAHRAYHDAVYWAALRKVRHYKMSESGDDAD